MRGAQDFGREASGFVDKNRNDTITWEIRSKNRYVTTSTGLLFICQWKRVRYISLLLKQRVVNGRKCFFSSCSFLTRRRHFGSAGPVEIRKEQAMEHFGCAFKRLKNIQCCLERVSSAKTTKSRPRRKFIRVNHPKMLLGIAVVFKYYFKNYQFLVKVIL